MVWYEFSVYFKYNCLLTDLNHQPSVYKTDALPIEPSRLDFLFLLNCKYT